MKSQTVLPMLASLAFCASAALAQETPPPDRPMGGHEWRMNKEDMAKMHAKMCSDIAPRAIGKLAYLQAKLNLTETQKPLFERWKSIVLSSIKAHAGACMEMKMPGPDMSAVEMAKMQEKHLQARLADLQAQMPALESLVGSLNPEQKETFDHAAMRMLHERGEMMEHMHHMMDGGHRGMMMRAHGPDAPPPPPAQ